MTTHREIAARKATLARQLTPAGADALRAASLREDGRYFYVPVAAYERAVEEHSRPDWRQTPWSTRGPALWQSLHTWSRTADLSRVPEWLAAFERQIGCGDCLSHWRAWCAANPPDVSSHEGLWAWTVEAHNDCNRRLGKPQWTP